MADECTNINGTEKFSLCVRLISQNQVVEQFLGCWPIVPTKAADIHICILAGLSKFGLDPKQLACATFDCAASMS